ncbi:hypothetical protein BIW11_07366 [Tropilaelaps mercedesae]|uniref:Non-structural maintenance of chromosomes element 1 homolog n=1 Tax=Tropilaelaps mercedesae TaxID=418985 RepID=A0A1V9XUF2_9ACAR|nr:hypothetical protein BIW11_07366 [Tropilaelaps mercedesae]
MASIKHQQMSRSLTQVLLDRRFMPTVEIREVVTKLNEKYDYDLDVRQDRDLDEYIAKLNDSLILLHLKIVQTRDEVTGDRLVLLCNTLASDLSLHPEFNEQQMAWFRHVVEKIATAPEGFISRREALDAISEVRNCKLSEAQAEQTLKELIKQKYLEDNSDEHLSLSPIAIVELGPYLVSILEDKVVKCAACTSLCLQGVRCATSNCPAKIHRACAEKLVACRLCKKRWT